MDFRVLGPFEVETARGPVELRGEKRRGLLAYLVVHRGALCRTDQIIEALWDGQAAQGAVGTVQTYVSQLRKLLDSNTRIVTRSGGYVLEANAESIDAELFERLLDGALLERDAPARLEQLDRALKLFRGPPLEEFVGEAWADESIRRWERLHLVATEQLGDVLLELSRSREAVPILERAVAVSPLHERFWVQLAIARYCDGDAPGALAACRDARRALVESLGVDPGPDLRALERRILDHDPTLVPSRAAETRMASMPTGVLTFLITDIDRSARLWENSPQQMADALARHDQLIDDAVTAGGGRVFKHSGDGLLAVFRSPAAAVAAAVEAQRALLVQEWTTTEPIRARMSLHAGEAVMERGGDYFGPVLNRCARVLALAHASQILVTGTVADSLRDHPVDSIAVEPLGEYRLRDLAQPERIAEVRHDDLPRYDSPLRSLESAGSLPVQLASFVGRDEERQHLIASVRNFPLSTLVGPGGIGKTRLAIRAAQELADDFTGGAWFIDLASVADNALVAGELASVLGVSAGLGHDFLDAVVQGLADRELLIVLDNCEQVIDGVAKVAASLLRGAPRVRMIATSRQPLELAGEAVLRIGPLPCGPDSRRNDAVALFVERARAASSTFVANESNVDDIRKLCLRLDGIPLALELAAARSRLLQPADLLARLDDRFRLLRGSRDQEARHRTLRAAIDWSYELLTEPEQSFFGRLSVCRGGFTLDAAEAIGAAGDMLDLLDRLVSRSFVAADLHRMPTRYNVLETIREYGADRLALSGAQADAQECHARYFLAHRDHSDDDVDNVRAAVDWQVVHEPDGAAQTVLDLWEAYAPARLLDLQRWLTQLVDRIDRANVVLRARLLERLGDACFQTGVGIDDAIGWLEQALAIREKRGETVRAARVHVRLARNLSGYPQLMDIERAMDHAGRAESILAEAGDHGHLAEVHLMKASTALYGRHNRAGVAAAQSAMRLGEEEGLEPIRLHALAQLGLHLGYCGEVEEGFTVLEEAWEEGDLVRDHFAQFLAAWMRGFGALLLWDPQDALIWFQRERRRAESEEAPLQARTLDSMIALAHLRTGDGRAAQAIGDDALNAPQLVPFAATLAGDWNRAIRLLSGGAEASRRRGNRNEWTQIALVLAQTHLRLGNREAASRLAGEVLDTLLEEPAPYYELPIRALLARMGVNDAEHLDACSAICSGHDYRGLVGAVSLAAAERAARAEEFDCANTAYAAACATFRDYNLRLDEAEALAAWSRTLASAGDAAGANERAARCRERLDGLDAPRWRRLLLPGRWVAQRGSGSAISSREG